MGIIDRLNKKVSPAATKSRGTKIADDKVAMVPVAPESAELTPTRLVPVHLATIIRRPVVSEKAAMHGAHNTYVFEVAISAEKIAIRQAVERVYGVKVARVRTMQYWGKPIQRGRRLSSRGDWKKALVTLVDGQKLDLYAGV
jgi:large subunit ribosomal protein L23